MNNNEILKGNKLIAEFMNIEKTMTFGCKRYIYENFSGKFSKELYFNSSWDWLMPVIDKIYSLNEYCVYKIENSSQFNDSGVSINTKYIQETYNEVVEFIKWYNEQKTN